MSRLITKTLNYVISHYRKAYIFPFWLILFFLSLVYQLMIRYLRRRGYRHAVNGIFVVSVGNITAGGTGKTEAVGYLSRIFSGNMRTAVILRGYRGRRGKDAFPVLAGTRPEEAGDEAILHRMRTRSLVIVARKKRDGVMMAKKKACRMAFLDDAFQHWDLKRNFNLVLIDHTNPFGNGHLLPAGILREPLSSLRDAHAILITKCEKNPSRRDPVLKIIRRHNKSAPVFFSRYIPEYISLKGKKVPQGKIRNRKILLFAGLGNMSYFVFLVKKHLKPRQMKAVSFPDHYAYNERDAACLEKMRNEGYDILLTTAKDYVKLSATGLEAYVFHIRLEITGSDYP